MKLITFKKYSKPVGISLVVITVLFLAIDNIVMPIYVQKGKTIKVPDVVGLPFKEAEGKIHAAGLIPKIAEYKSDKRYEIGVVIVQNPSAEFEVKYDRGIYLTISGGEDLVVVPTLRGKSVREASFNLERVGLKLGDISFEPSDEIFANTIIRQEIAPATKVSNGKKIDVVVSQGKASDKHSVPDVALRTLIEAEKILKDCGFKPGKISYQPNIDLLPNTVLDQLPRAGEQLTLGEAIDLTVVQKADKKKK
jgi:eukaryotic-like serine/threonine-protein kinase